MGTQKACHMQESVKAKKDRINELPDGILSSIVSYLTVRDAANASLLSSRWRHICSSISKLIFDLSTMYGKAINRRIKSNDDVHSCQPYKDRFIQGVNQFLRYYNGTRLVCFKVLLCLDIDSTCHIDHWVSFAVSRGVEVLCLNLACMHSEYDGRDLYILRSELFLNQSVAKVQRLFLNSCILGPGVIDQFSGLKYLTLVNTCLSEEGLESILTNSIYLESISLAGCTLPLKLCISGSFHRLKFLAVLQCFQLEEIKLSDLKLTTFEYVGSMIKFSFCRVPNLNNVFFSALDGEGLQYVFSQLAKDLPLVKNLSVSSGVNWVQHLPKDMTTFKNVKTLELISNQREELNMLRMIFILRACPFLEKFYLTLNSTVFIEEGTFLPPKFAHEHLKEVHIGRFLYIRCYFEFAIFMLEYAVALKKMILDPKLKIYTGYHRWDCNNETWGERKRQKVRERLKAYLKSAVLIVK